MDQSTSIIGQTVGQGDGGGDAQPVVTAAAPSAPVPGVAGRCARASHDATANQCRDANYTRQSGNGSCRCSCDGGCWHCCFGCAWRDCGWCRKVAANLGESARTPWRELPSVDQTCCQIGLWCGCCRSVQAAKQVGAALSTPKLSRTPL
jgi:hypothetical protein